MVQTSDQTKPPQLDFQTAEKEIKAFRDWSWQLTQYLTAIDEGFDKELQQLFDDPSKALDMVVASADTRQRSANLYGLLASLVRNKALNLVKTVGGSNGYEALRQMILALRPNSNNRGLALLRAATSWPQFKMQNLIQEQLLKLEDVFEETRKAGTTIQPELKTAILMKSVGGQLKKTPQFGYPRQHQIRRLERTGFTLGPCSA